MHVASDRADDRRDPTQHLFLRSATKFFAESLDSCPARWPVAISGGRVVGAHVTSDLREPWVIRRSRHRPVLQLTQRSLERPCGAGAKR